MTNFELIKNMSVEQLAAFLAHETYRIAYPAFQYFGVGICEQVIYARRKEWLLEEITEKGGEEE